MNARNNTISTVFYRNTGEALSYLSAISSGKENTTPILRFFLQVFTKSRDAKAHESHNLNAFVLGNAHFNPLVETIPNIHGSAAGPDSHILLLTNGTTRTSGQIFLPINSAGKFAHKEMRPKVKRSTDTIPESVEASESEDESSDEENPSSANLGKNLAKSNKHYEIVSRDRVVKESDETIVNRQPQVDTDGSGKESVDDKESSDNEHFSELDDDADREDADDKSTESANEPQTPGNESDPADAESPSPSESDDDNQIDHLPRRSSRRREKPSE
jgi:hypothetical protein